MRWAVPLCLPARPDLRPVERVVADDRDHAERVEHHGAYGDGRRQIWATEFGAPTGTTGYAVSEAAQAQLVTDAFAALCAAPWAGPAFLYSYRDDGTDPADFEHSLGLVRHDWSAKPAYRAYQASATAGC